MKQSIRILGTPELCRSRALQYRQLMRSIRDPVTTGVLLRMARELDRRACRLERQRDGPPAQPAPPDHPG